jgi:hypothetical protein
MTSVCIVSILRVHSLFVLAHNERDPMFYSAPPVYWASIEMNLAIVCACVPALKPLVVKVIPAFSSRRSGNDSSQRSEASKVSKISHSFQRLDGKGSLSNTRSIDTEQGLASMEMNRITALPHVHLHDPERGEIRVVHDLEQRSFHQKRETPSGTSPWKI